MASTKKADMTKYIVQNPRGIPAGRFILRNGNRLWFEGDEFTPPAGCDVERLVSGGFIKAVSGSANAEPVTKAGE